MGDDTMPTPSMGGDRMVLSLGGRTVTMPDGVKALGSARPLPTGWLFIGVTQSRPGGVFENTKVLQLDTSALKVSEVASGRAITSLLVSPDGEKFAWVDRGTTEPGVAPSPALHIDDLSTGIEVLADRFDESQVGEPVAWSGSTLTFARTRVAENGGAAHDARWPISTFDSRSKTWARGSAKRQFENVSVVPVRSGDTTAIVQAREPGGDRQCLYRLVNPEPLGCETTVEVSFGGRFLAISSDTSADGNAVLDSSTLQRVAMPEQVRSQLRYCDWATESVLVCALERGKPGNPTVRFLWSVTQGAGQQVDLSPMSPDDNGIEGRISG
jgi:hypothetical protein